MAEYLGTPLFAYQVIMPDDPTMGMEFLTVCKRKDEGFITQPHKLDQVASFCYGLILIIHFFSSHPPGSPYSTSTPKRVPPGFQGWLGPG